MKKQATLWGPDAPIINGYQKDLEAKGYRVTRMEHLPDEFSWVALQLPHILPVGYYHNDAVARAIEGLEPIGWNDDPLDLGGR